jgi:hypothetical protein
MNEQPRDFYQLGHHLLRGLYSFVPASAVEGAVVKKMQLASDEILVGMYLNAPDNFVVFTSSAFRWIRKEREIICSYGAIESIKLPENKQDADDEREIEVALKDGDFLFLPILGDTEGEADIYTVFQYLEEATSGSGNLQSLADLIARLRAEIEAHNSGASSWKQPMPVEYFISLIGYLEKCLMDCLNGPPSPAGGKYDPITLDQPQTWRLMAEVLLAPKTIEGPD